MYITPVASILAEKLNLEISKILHFCPNSAQFPTNCIAYCVGIVHCDVD